MAPVSAVLIWSRIMGLSEWLSGKREHSDALRRLTD
jgi:hypothetical protein